LEEETACKETYAEQFDVASPEAVSITAYAFETSQPIEDVWKDASAWKTARQRITLLERALTTGSGGVGDQRTAI